MTNPHNPDDPLDDQSDPAGAEASGDDVDRVEAIFIGRRTPTKTTGSSDPYDLGWLFLCWCWESGYGSWEDGLRSLVRALRALEEIGLIERRRIRRDDGRPTHHGFVLTEEGREAVAALSGDWIDDRRENET